MPAATEFLQTLRPSGFAAHLTANRELTLGVRKILFDALSTEPPTAESMVGSTVTIPLPESSQASAVGIRYSDTCTSNIASKSPVFQEPKTARDTYAFPAKPTTTSPSTND